jgi:hypothetical protein
MNRQAANGFACARASELSALAQKSARIFGSGGLNSRQVEFLGEAVEVRARELPLARERSSTQMAAGDTILTSTPTSFKPPRTPGLGRNHYGPAPAFHVRLGCRRLRSLTRLGGMPKCAVALIGRTCRSPPFRQKVTRS